MKNGVEIGILNPAFYVQQSDKPLVSAFYDE